MGSPKMGLRPNPSRFKNFKRFSGGSVRTKFEYLKQKNDFFNFLDAQSAPGTGKIQKIGKFPEMTLIWAAGRKMAQI